jgi:hypothetical protein
MPSNVSLTEDYLVRQINIYLAAIGRILGFKTAYMYLEAKQAIDEALEEIFGLPANLVREMDDPALLNAVTYAGVMNLDKIQAAAEVFRLEGELAEMRGQPGQAIFSFQRALNFFLDAALNGGAWNLPFPEEQIQMLARRLSGEKLEPEILYGLYLFARQQGLWKLAEEWLQRMEAEPDLQEEAGRLRQEFSADLLRQPDETLAKAGYQRADLQERIAAETHPGENSGES